MPMGVGVAGRGMQSSGVLPRQSPIWAEANSDDAALVWLSRNGDDETAAYVSE